MKYMGSKNRLAKYIVPIIQSYITAETKGYLEPFVGGANVIDKIDCSNRIGCDIHEYLIALLKKVSNTTIDLPSEVDEELYYSIKNNKEKYDDWLVGFVLFCGSFGGKFECGYARGKDNKGNPRNYFSESIRNLTNQSKNIKDIKFKCLDFRNIPKDKIKGYVIYCDPPYRDTTSYKTSKFPYDEFYNWCREMSIHNTVLVSEYNMPDDFTCIWEKETTTQINSNRKAGSEKNVRVERLYILNNQNT